MAKTEAKRAMKETLMSGFRHHNDILANTKLKTFLMGHGSPDILSETGIDIYNDILAPDSQRAMMNGLICLITVVSRVSIELGVGAEQSFSLSDYYIYTVEMQKNKTQLENLMNEMLEQYADLVQAEQCRAYSLHVTRAIRYITSNLYEPIRVSEVAAHIKLNPQYFCVLFKEEVGVDPSVYIRQRKMTEAASLLKQSDISVSEIAEVLGYCTSSHFAREFKKTYGKTPKEFVKAESLLST